jgi:hypothetical protein
MDTVLKRVEYLKKLGFNFIEYEAWKKRKLRRSQKTIEQEESCGAKVNLEQNKCEEKILYNEYRKDIVHHYFNLSYKIPEKRPRKIYKCSNFLCPEKLKDGLNRLEEKIIRGDDLLPNLSREIFDSTYRDYLLYDFGIVHFHLGTKPLKKNPLLIKSTNELVYAFIDNDSCYFIRIGHHNNWDDINLLSTLKKDFPQVLNRWKILGEPVPKLSNKDRKKLIKNCINTWLEIDGEYYMSPGMGMNTAGTSSLAVMNMNRNFNKFIKLQEDVKQLILKNLKEIEKSLGKNLTDMHLILQETEPEIIYEPNNNLRISIINGRMEIRNCAEI